MLDLFITHATHRVRLWNSQNKDTNIRMNKKKRKGNLQSPRWQDIEGQTT